MALVKQGGSNPYAGKVMTTRGFRDLSERLCYACGLHKADDLFTVDANGRAVCPECAGSKGRGVLQEVEVERDPDEADPA